MKVDRNQSRWDWSILEALRSCVAMAEDSWSEHTGNEYRMVVNSHKYSLEIHRLVDYSIRMVDTGTECLDSIPFDRDGTLPLRLNKRTRILQ